MVCFKEEKEESISCEKKGKIKKEKAIFERRKTTHDFFIHFRQKDALTIRKKKIEKRRKKKTGSASQKEALNNKKEEDRKRNKRKNRFLP
jgi:hypothetical protein